MTDPFRGFSSAVQYDPSSGDPATIAAGIEQLILDADRFQLKWRIVPATVLTSSTGYTKVRIDGDGSASNAVSLIGPVPTDGRVMILSIPPSNKFIIGTVGQSRPALALRSKALRFVVPATINTTSAAFANIVGATFKFTKEYTQSKLALWLSATFAITGSPSSGAGFAIRINGVDYIVGRLPGGVAAVSARYSVSGTVDVPANALKAGIYDIQVRWQRASGTGQANMFINDDEVSWRVTECFD